MLLLSQNSAHAQFTHFRIIQGLITKFFATFITKLGTGQISSFF